MRRKRILIFRPDNIGDVVLFSGALKHLRLLYPGAHLTLAVQPHILNLVELCPYIDHCISVKKLTWLGRIADLNLTVNFLPRKIIQRLNLFWNFFFKSYDTIIYPVKSPEQKHLVILRDLNCRTNIGIIGCHDNVPIGGYIKGLEPTTLLQKQFDVSKCNPWRHELETTYDFLQFLGCQIYSQSEVNPEIWPGGADSKVFPDGGSCNKKTIGIFPGASSPLRCWEPLNYSELARLLGNHCRYVVFGGETDIELAELVASFIQKGNGLAQIANFAGKTTLRELAKKISKCDLLISMDTSGLHLAITVGVPTVAIIGGGHYGRFVPWGDPQRNVFLCKELDCFYCCWRCDKELARCIQGVLPREVSEAAKRLLSVR